MNASEVSILVATICGLGIVAAFIALIAYPAWMSYSRTWERVAASFLSLFVLLSLVLVGALGGAAIAYYWDSIAA